MKHPPKRERMITARVSAKEKEYVKRTAARLGTTINSLIYDSVMRRAAEVGVFDEGNRQQAKS